MMKTFAALALAAAVAGPAFANDEMARKLGVPPGEFTLNELVQITDTNGRYRATRIALIRAKHKAFAEAVTAAQRGMVSTAN